jgi:hypothetical protein
MRIWRRLFNEIRPGEDSGNTESEPPKPRRLLFGDRLAGGKWAIPTVPLVAATGVGAHQALGGGGGDGGTPVTAGSDGKVIVSQAPESKTLVEVFAERGLRANVSSLMVEPPSPAEVRRATDRLKKLGYDVRNFDIAIVQFQNAVGLEVTGVLDERTERKIASTLKRVNQHRTPYLTQGQAGPRVERLQQRLRRLGDFQGVPDGIYGDSTVQAVLKFRDRHKKHDNGVRSWTKGTHATLMQELANISHDPYRSRVKPTKNRRKLDRKAATEARVNGIGPGSPRDVIRYVQEQLKLAGYNTNAPTRLRDVRWDDHTQAMMHQFQDRAGLPKTERMGKIAWQRLSALSLETRSEFNPPIRINERSRAVLHLERNLRAAGENIEPDHRYTERTERLKDHALAKLGVHGTSGAGARVHRLVHKRIEQRNQAMTRTVKGCAKLLLQNPNVHFWSVLSTGSDIKAMRSLARTGTVRVPVTGQVIKPNLRMMQALVDMAKHGPIQINALTGGVHSVGSNHYSGTAVDLSIFVGDSGEIERIANQHGGFRNFETDHIHLDF